MRRFLATAACLCLAHAALAAVEPTIGGSNAHVLVGKRDGTVSTWGSDLFGKLGTSPKYRGRFLP